MVSTLFKSAQKQHVRKEIKELLRQSKSEKYLGLSNFNFEIEKLAIELGIQPVSCERDLNIFKQQLLIAPEGVKLIHDDIKNVVLQEEYNFIWLDFCGTLSRSTRECFENLYFTRPTDVIITVCFAHETSEIQSYINIYDRVNSYIRFFERYGLATHKTCEYVDSRIPMCAFFTKNIPAKKINSIKLTMK